MFIIVNKNKQNNKFLPMLSLVEKTDELKKAVKKQIMDNILNDPESLRAYKNIETYKIAEINDEEYNIKPLEKKELLYSYEDLINEIIKILIKETK